MNEEHGTLKYLFWEVIVPIVLLIAWCFFVFYTIIYAWELYESGFFSWEFPSISFQEWLLVGILIILTLIYFKKS